MPKLENILKTTSQNISKNRWMSVATVIVISIVFTITIFFVGVALLAKKAISYYEKKAQIMIYFVQSTPEDEILAMKERLTDPIRIEEILYISETDAVKSYSKTFQDEPEFLENITVGTLPASIEIRAKSAEYLSQILHNIELEKKNSAYVEDVWYLEDVIDKMKTISQIINYGGSSLIIALVVVSFVLVIITIEFNIMAHSDEIEIMHLVGSPDTYIRAPYILEGALYGFLGSLFASLFLLIPFIISLGASSGTDLLFWVGQQLAELDLKFLINPSPVLIILFVITVCTVGVLLGSLGSLVAVARHLNLEEK